MRKIFLSLLLFMFVFSFFHPLQASATPFVQGEGYEKGGYDFDAIHPTYSNWSGQSRFEGPKKFNVYKKIYSKDYGFDLFTTSPIMGKDGTLYVVAELKGYPYLVAIDTNFKLKWTHKSTNPYGTEYYMSIATDGNIYVSSDAGWILEIISPDGKLVWSVPYGGAISIDNNGDVYLANNGHTQGIHMIGSDATHKWHFNDQFRQYVPYARVSDFPIITSNGQLLVSGIRAEATPVHSGIVYIMDKSGNWIDAIASSPNSFENWQSSDEDRYSLPTLDDKGNVYIVSYTKLFSYDKDFNLRWSKVIDKTNDINVTPSIPIYVKVGNEERIIVLTSYNLSSFDLNGNMIWQKDIMLTKTTPIVDKVGNIYFDGLAYNFDGKLIFQNSLKDYYPEPKTRPFIDQYGLLYLLLNDGNDNSSSNYITIVGEKKRTKSSNFTDIYIDEWFSQDVDSLVKQKIINGYPDKTFRPINNVTREEAFKMIISSLKIPFTNVENLPFRDILKTNWAYPYISTSFENNILLPDMNNSFFPLKNLTRAEMARLLNLAFNFENNNSHVTFNDVSENHWAYSDIVTLASVGIAKGLPGGNFNPDGTITRAEFSAFLNRAMNQGIKK